MTPDWLSSNPLLFSGLVLGAAGLAVQGIRPIATSAARAVYTRYVMQLEVTSGSPAFEWVSRFLGTQEPVFGPKSYMTGEDHYASYSSAYMDRNLAMKGRRLTQAPGVYLYRVDGQQMWVSFTYQWMQGQPVPVRKYHLSFPGGSRATVNRFLERVQRHYESSAENQVQLYQQGGGGGFWDLRGLLPKRPLDSVVARAGLLEEVRGDLERFLAREGWYRERHVPYRRGYLLTGPPGTGKSTLALALASEFNLNICTIQLSDPYLSDSSLMRSIAHLPPRSVLLLEDIDCVQVTRSREEGNAAPVGVLSLPGTQSSMMPVDRPGGLTLSGLLNALDGVGAQEGSVVIMTTNHPERLDPALLRAGRVDVQVKLDLAGEEVAHRMYLRFFPDDEVGARRFVEQMGSPVSQAVLQEQLLTLSNQTEPPKPVGWVALKDRFQKNPPRVPGRLMWLAEKVLDDGTSRYQFLPHRVMVHMCAFSWCGEPGVRRVRFGQHVEGVDVREFKPLVEWTEGDEVPFWTPTHEHHCAECVYMGSTSDEEDRVHDLYFCAQDSAEQNIIVRFGNGSEYDSWGKPGAEFPEHYRKYALWTLNSGEYAQSVAFNLAVELGFIQADLVPLPAGRLIPVMKTPDREVKRERLEQVEV